MTGTGGCEDSVLFLHKVKSLAGHQNSSALAETGPVIDVKVLGEWLLVNIQLLPPLLFLCNC